MANVDSVRGLKLVGTLSGIGIPTIRKCFIPASDGTAVFVGDLVKVAGSASSTQIGCPTVAQAAAGDTNIMGVVVSVDQIDEVDVGSHNLSRRHRPASTAMYVYVCTDPKAVYEIQEDSVGGALSVAEVGENADVVVGSGSTTTGMSGMELDSSTHTSATAQLRILGFVDKPDNEVGDNAKVLVMINEHAYATTSGT